MSLKKEDPNQRWWGIKLQTALRVTKKLGSRFERNCGSSIGGIGKRRAQALGIMTYMMKALTEYLVEVFHVRQKMSI